MYLNRTFMVTAWTILCMLACVNWHPVQRHNCLYQPTRQTRLYVYSFEVEPTKQATAHLHAWTEPLCDLVQPLLLKICPIQRWSNIGRTFPHNPNLFDIKSLLELQGQWLHKRVYNYGLLLLWCKLPMNMVSKYKHSHQEHVVSIPMFTCIIHKSISQTNPPSPQDNCHMHNYSFFVYMLLAEKYSSKNKKKIKWQRG